MSEKILFELVLDTEKLNAVAKEAAKELTVLKNEQKKLRDTGKENTVEYQKLSNEILRNKKILKDTTKTLQDNTRAQKSQSNSILDLRNKLKIATAERNKMSAAERDGTRRGRELTRTIRALNDELKKQERIVGDNRRNVGNYADVLKRGTLRVKDFALQMVGWVAIIATVTRAILSAIKITIKYEKELSTLRSITGSTKEEMLFFAKASISVGQATKTSATEVVKAFTLIGSAQPELLKNSEALAEVTKQALILSKAGGIDTVAAARALTSAMNQFGASAEDAAKFTDIFATSQQKGSSFINDTSLALENSGAAADAAGISFETTNAAIQALAKGALLGARAGTALRGVLSKLSSQSDDEINPSMVGLGATIAELAKRNLTLKEAIQLVGLESATGLLTLIKQKDIFFELEGSLNDVGNAMEQMRINTDNLDGSLDELSNSWEAYVLSLSESDGVLNSVVKITSSLLQAFTGTRDQALLLAKQLGLDRKIVGRLENQLGTYADVVVELERRIDKLNLKQSEHGLVTQVNIEGALTITEILEKWRQTQNKLNGVEEDAIIVEEKRAKTIGELKKELQALLKAQNNLLPQSKELAANQAEILKIEKLLGKENKARIKELKELKKEEADLEAQALKLKKLMADAEVAIIRDKEARLEAIEALRFKRLEAGIIKEFGRTKDTKTLIEQLEIVHHQNLAKIADDAAVKILDDDLKEIERKKIQDEKDEEKARRDTDIKAVNQQLAKETAINAGQEISDALFANSNRNREREFAASLQAVNDKADTAQSALDNQLTNNLISQQQFNEKTKQLDDKKAADETKLRKTAFKEQKRLDLLQVAINGALAIVKAIAQFGPPPSPAGIAAIAAAIITTGTQLVFIKGQKFKKGGIADTGGMLKGEPHTKGGIPFTVDGHTGFEAQGGEPILTKGVGDDPRLRAAASALNVAGGGRAFNSGGIADRIGKITYQDGGFANRKATSVSAETEKLGKIISEEISKITIVASIEDIIDANDIKIKIQDRRSV